jgi:phasin family protein
MAEKPPKSQPTKTGSGSKVQPAAKSPRPITKSASPSSAAIAAPPPVEKMAPKPVTPEPTPEPKAIAPEPKEIIMEDTAPSKSAEIAPPVAATVEKADAQPEPEPEHKEPEPNIELIPAAAEEGTNLMTDAIETTKKVATEAKEKFQAMFGDFNEKAKAAVEKSSKIVEEMNELTKGNVEAIVESSKIAAKGAESLGQEAAEYSRKNFEKATATMKSFASVKSPTEFFQLQSEFFSSAFDSMASEASKSSEALLKLAGDVVQPLSSRAAVVSEKVKSFTA